MIYYSKYNKNPYNMSSKLFENYSINLKYIYEELTNKFE